MAGAGARGRRPLWGSIPRRCWAKQAIRRPRSPTCATARWSRRLLLFDLGQFDLHVDRLGLVGARKLASEQEEAPHRNGDDERPDDENRAFRCFRLNCRRPFVSPWGGLTPMSRTQGKCIGSLFASPSGGARLLPSKGGPDKGLRYRRPFRAAR